MRGSAMDPGIAKLIERTRARRGELAELSSDRSPLPSEARQRDRSPLKQTRSPSKVKPSYVLRIDVIFKCLE